MFSENNNNHSSPNSIYSSCFSRSSTPVNHESLSAYSSANNTPLPTKDCEMQFPTASVANPPSNDTANPPSPPSIKLEQPSHNDSVRNIWNNKSLSIDISRANSKMAGNNLSRTSGANGQTSFLLDRSNAIWNTTFTPSSEFFGKNITSNNRSNHSSNLSISSNNLNVSNSNNNNNLGYFDKSPMMSSFGNNLEIYPAHSNLVTPRSAVFNSFDAAANAKPIITPTQFSFGSNNNVNMMSSEMSLSNKNGATNQILEYFSKNQNTQINQLGIDDVQNINYESIFQNNIQLPKFFMPGQQQQTHLDNHYGHDYGMNPLVLVGFKNGRLDIFYYCLNSIPNGLNNGDMVIVEADRGKDLGMVVSTNISIDDARVLKMMQNQEQNEALKFDGNANTNGNVAATLTAAAAAASNNMMNDNNNSLQSTHIPKQILRVAMPNEVSQIYNKESDELKALSIMQSKIGVHQTPMKVLGAEYQWDRRKLTFYYVANKRIDFRDLVKDIFRIYKTRIWMCAVIPTDMSIKNEIEMNDTSINASVNQFNSLANSNNNYSYVSNMNSHARNNSSISNFVLQQQMAPLPSFEIQAPTPTNSVFEQPQESSLLVPQFNSIWEA